jgi:hypothetical protein
MRPSEGASSEDDAAARMASCQVRADQLLSWISEGLDPLTAMILAPSRTKTLADAFPISDPAPVMTATLTGR